VTSSRSTKDGPFCWQNKGALRLIRDHFDSTNTVASALAVYVSLTEIASDEQSEVFARRVGDIASRAGLSYKTTIKVLHRLEALGLVVTTRNKVAGTKENAPSTYRLVRLGNKCPTSGNGSKQPSVPRKDEECLEEYLEKHRGQRPPRTHHSDEWRRDHSGEELEVIDLYNEICVPQGWRPVNKFSQALQEALETLVDKNLEDFKRMFETAVEEREDGDDVYNRRLGNKLIRILWNNV
jgi:hypothetical protein